MLMRKSLPRKVATGEVLRVCSAFCSAVTVNGNPPRGLSRSFSRRLYRTWHALRRLLPIDTEGNLLCRVADEISRDARLSDEALAAIMDRYGAWTLPESTRRFTL